jgi:cytochrome c553
VAVEFGPEFRSPGGWSIPLANREGLEMHNCSAQGQRTLWILAHRLRDNARPGGQTVENLTLIGERELHRIWCAGADFMKPVLALASAALLIGAGISQLPPKATEDPESVRLIDSLDGRALYQAYCAVCHGPDARGGGPMAASLKVASPDLTRIARRHDGVYPDALVERVISGEERLPGGHGTREMPIWGPIFSQVAWDQDLGRLRIHNLSAYIRRLQQQ